MSLLRNDQQVAANQLLVELKHGVAHFNHAVEILDDATVVRALTAIVGQREAITERFEAAVRELGELPSEPDLDRQGLARLYHRLEAAVSPDHCAEVLEQRLTAEQHLARLTADARRAGLGQSGKALLDELDDHIRRVTERLQSLLKQCAE